MNTIQRIIEIPLAELQTQKAKKTWKNNSDTCCLCGQKIGVNPKYVHYLTNGNITSYQGEDIENDQGFFPVGKECAKKLIINFAF